jgi:hypothetical protein
MFYQGQKQSLGKSSILPRDAKKITPMAGYMTKSLEREKIDFNLRAFGWHDIVKGIVN